jgi:methionyl-tRNA synthetase
MPEAKEYSDFAKSMLEEIKLARKEITELLSAHKYKRALDRLMRFAQAGNQFLENEKPWSTRKTDMDKCAMAVNIGLRVVEALSIVMAPFLPFSSVKLRAMLNLPELKSGDWDSELKLKAGDAINKPEILFRKFEDEEIAVHSEKLGS